MADDRRELESAAASTTMGGGEQEVSYPFQEAVVDAQLFAARLVGNRGFAVKGIDGIVPPFATQLQQYKSDKDDSHNNRNKAISDLLSKLLQKIAFILKTEDINPMSYKFVPKEASVPVPAAKPWTTGGLVAGAASETNLTLVDAQPLVHSDREGLEVVYKLLLIIRAVLNAEKKCRSESQIDRSAFMTTILKNLEQIFLSQQSTRLSKSKKSQLIDQVIERLTSYVNWFSYHGQMNGDQEGLSDALQQLFDYIVVKQTDSKHKVTKTDTAQAILELYFAASTSDDYVKLFQAIAQGIQLSRSEGKNGEQSRGLEHALRALRDWLVYNFFVHESAQPYAGIQFSAQQLQQIIDSISYTATIKAEKLMGSAKEMPDADVCPNTMRVIDALAKAMPPDEQTAATIVGLRVTHCQRLALQIPKTVNRTAKIDPNSYLCAAGAGWPWHMTEMLESKQLTWQQTQQLQVCALVWNLRMVEYYKANGQERSGVNLDYFVATSLLGPVKSYSGFKTFPPDLQTHFDERFVDAQELIGKMQMAKLQAEQKALSSSQGAERDRRSTAALTTSSSLSAFGGGVGAVTTHHDRDRDSDDEEAVATTATFSPAPADVDK